MDAQGNFDYNFENGQKVLQLLREWQGAENELRLINGISMGDLDHGKITGQVRAAPGQSCPVLGTGRALLDIRDDDIDHPQQLIGIAAARWQIPAASSPPAYST